MHRRPAIKNPPRRPRFEFEEVEPRQLFNADAMVGGLVGLDVPAAVVRNEQSNAPDPALSATHLVTSTALVQASEAPKREVAFVDMGIDDAQIIVDDLIKQQSEGRQIDIVQMSADEDGVAVITDYLRQQEQPITAIHVIGHGDAKGLQLGSVRLDTTSLSNRLQDVASWGRAMNGDSDLLLYGCNLAQGALGQDLIEQLALLTGADVAASDDYTGATRLGGDWTLEYATGQVDSQTALTAQAQGAWSHVLATASFRDGDSSGTNTSDAWIDSAAPNTANGGGQTIMVTNSSSKQILIKFDNIFGTDAGQIRYGSTISSASLTVYTTQDGTGNPAIYRILSTSWNESSTWNSLGSGISLNNVEASSTADSSVDVSGNNTTDVFLNLAATVQYWANGNANNGWVIVDNGNEWNFTASEGTEAQRPQLNVTYTAATPPTLDLDASGAGNNFSTTFIEGGAAVKIADTDATVIAGSNTVSPMLSGMTITISNRLDGTAETLAAVTGSTNITANYDTATGVLSLSGSDTAANYQSVLRSVTYQNSDDTPSTTSRSITVVATDPYGGNSATVTSTVAITATNDAPSITSNGAGATASVSVAETTTAVTTVTSTDPEGTARTYSIVAGNDGAKFSINSSTGVLSFVTAPDFEAPTDGNADNVYVVTVQASDGSLTDTQTISVTVTNVVGTLVVDTTADTNDSGLGASFTAEQLNASKGTDGKVSLREAIIASNNTVGMDTISFNMSSGAGTYGEFTILTASALPYLTDAVYINGATQSGYSTRPLIVLDGEGGSGYGLYLSNTADGSTIRGLLIRDFSADAIHVQAGSDNNTIVGNYLGSFNADGSNAGTGERNVSEGIESYGANLMVGGTTAADRNVISGNASAYNIYLASGANGSTIQGNYIGTDASGTTAFGSTNSSYGIMVESPATNITIGGTTNGAGNVISGFTLHGIWFTTSGTATIQGNKIGTDHTGLLDLGNGGAGIYVDDAGVVTIGGNTSAARNVISGNTTYGIDIRSSPAGGHVVKGNYIGVGADGTTLLGNGSAGIFMAASNTTIGGKAEGDGNLIAGNGGAGIAVNSGTGNLFYRNSIHSNTGLGIDLSNDGLSANDDGDGDGGGNYLNNFPVITSVVTNGSSTTISGSIEGIGVAQTVYIEFFSSPSVDASGHGEGRTYLGYVQVTTNATTGDATFTATLTGASLGDWITAVANYETGYLGASEFAKAVQAVAPSNAPRGKAIWNVNDRVFQQYSDWSSTGFSSVGVNGLNFGDDISMITVAEAPTRKEIIFVGSADASGKILAGIWNGSTWSSVISIPVASPSATASQFDSYAIAYDELSGNAILIWDNGNTATTGLSYAIWDGSNWSTTSNITAPVSGEPVHMKLAASPSSHDMVLAVQTTASTNNQYVIVWNGSTWGNAQTLGTNTSKQYFELNVAYERLSGQAMVIYDASATDAGSVQYRTWSGSAWSSEGSIATPTGITAASELYTTVMASDPGSDRIAMGAKNAAHEVWFAVWDGSAWGTGQAATTSGVTLPDHHATMAVAFESQSGDLLAAYGKAAGPNVYFRTWTSASGWSGEFSGPSLGGTDVPYVVKLFADPYTNTIMLGVQDAASDLSMVAWDGSAWGTVTELDAATGHTYRENFTYVWFRDAAVITQLDGDALNYNEGDTATPIDQGTSASVSLDSVGGYSGGNLTVAFIAGSTLAEDVLGIRHQGLGAGQIGLSGSNVTYAGVTIGTWAGGSAGSNLVITFNGNATDAAVTALVRNITYANGNSVTPSTTDRTARFVITSGQGRSSANNDVTIRVAAVNDPPVNTVPGAQNVNEDGTLVFSSGNGNLISIADGDAGSSPMQISLSVAHGTLTLSSLAGLSFSVGDGTVDANMVFTGTASAINAALNGLAYAPTAHYNGNETLSITTSDLGNSGSGGTLSDTDTVAITVNAVNDAPVISSDGGGANASINVAENTTWVTTVLASDLEGNALSYSIAGGADAAMFSIHAVTGALSFVTAPDRENPLDAGGNHIYDVIVQVSDGSLADTQSLAVTVTPVNDCAPVITSQGGGASATVSVAENTTAVATVTATDADLPAQSLIYSIIGGADAALFAVNASSGALSFNSARNRELASDANGDHVYEVVVQASDGSNTDTQAISVSITDINEFNVGSLSDTNPSADTVAEGATNGTLVGITASASDADASTNAIAYSLSDSAGGRFAINASTGVVTVADGSLLNYEAATSHSITVLATSADGSTSSQVFTVNLSDVDEFDVGAVTDVNPASNTVAENAANGTTVGITASASDADGTTNTVSYSLSDSSGGRFGINASTGVVTVTDSSLLNYETATSHTITVLATSADGSTSSQTFAVNLNDVDEFNVGPVTDVNAAANSVVENATNGTVVGITASANDADGTTNTITYSLSDSSGGRFAINASTGVVTVADSSLLNFEAATSHSITVLATSADGSTSNQAFAINLSDVDEFDVGAVTDVNPVSNAVAENAANGTMVGITASASDADATTNTITYSLSDSSGGRFGINASTGVVTVADSSLLNFESATSHSITVLATSADGSTSSQTFAVNLNDVDEFNVGPVTDVNAAANWVAENAANGTVVGITASATDADATTNAITYSLSNSAGGRFAINASTGVVTVADGSQLNYEAATSHSITVLATSADGSTSSQAFTVNLSDVDEFDVGAVTDVNASTNTVAENAANGTAVGITASASDVDATTNTITYSLSDSSGGRFAINASTGVVTVADNSLLNYETSTSHTITVLSTSADGSTSSQTFAINLSDVDELDVGAVTDANAAANAVAENAANGTTVGITASASDADGTTNTISYSLSNSAGGRFAINASTGTVTVADGSLLNYESATSHGITVLATSADGSTSSQVFTVNLSDVDEFDVGAVTDVNAVANSVAENAATGTVVGITAYATDADATTNTISYSLSDSAGGRFAINSSTGVVTVADASLLNYEAATSHSITVLATSLDGSSNSQTFSINLVDVGEGSIGATTDANGSANVVAENAANGTAVGLTVQAVDPDVIDNVSYTLTDDAGGRFAINAGTGVVTVADGSLLNHEITPSHTITVLSTSSDGTSSTQTFTINLSDVDEFDVGAVTDVNAAANSVAENAANGTMVGITASATDADATTNAITYSLSNSAGGRFAINASTGVVTVADGSLLNHETATSHSITVQATSADGSTSSQAFTVNLSDVDEFDVGAVTDVNAAANSVAENATTGTVVGITASANDADGATNTITYSLSDSAGGRFAINTSTGVVTVADGSPLNYEAAASHNITVLATSADGSTSSQAFTVNLSDVDEFDVGAVTDVNAAANTVAENAANGTTVGITASAADADATTNTITYSLSDSSGGRFGINASTGVVTVADSSLLNYETATSHTITVLATSADGSTSNQAFAINLSDVDEFDVGAFTDVNPVSNTVAENAANGTTVGITASTSDADATTNTITYSLSDSSGGRFSINASTGVVTVADSSLLNYETATSHTITVLATSADGSISSQAFTVNLSDVDEFDVGAVTDVNAAANTVAENAANGTVVGITASATDADATTNAITYSLSNSAGGRFDINASTGVVTVADASLLNYEAATSHSITVLATSADGSTNSQSFTVSLVDVGEASLGTTTDTNVSLNVVAENAANGTTVGITAQAVEPDVIDAVSYALTDDAGGRFAINAGTGVVTVADGSLLNFEATNSHTITVLSTSSDGTSSTQTFAISLSDVNEFDVGALSDTNAAANSVAENASAGTMVGITASASDVDATTNGITYSLSTSAGGRFVIDAVTGIVTVADGSLLNFEAATSHSITVVATSADGSSSSQAFTINLSDDNEFTVGAVTDINLAANSVAENAANGTEVGITSSASDPDSSNNGISYSLSDSAGGRFAIHASTGVVTVANGSLLSHEVATSHSITVVATSTDGSSSSQAITINITDVDEFDVGAVTDADSAANSLAENASNGTLVGITASAKDADSSNNTITYTLADSADGRFNIDAITGVVSVADSSLLNYEGSASHNITVLASSLDGSSNSQTFTINLSDVSEFSVGPVGDADAAANTVAENAANGSAVGITASASDADGSNNAIIYSLSDSAGGRFAIDSTTGNITVANGAWLDHESATSHTVTVMALSSDGSSTSQTIAIQVAPVNDNAPTLWAAGGADPSSIPIQEATTQVIVLAANDADVPSSALTFGLAGGIDASWFTMDPSTGALSFKAPPSMTQPLDNNQDNVYEVLVQVSDGLFATQLPLRVMVTPAPLTPTPEPVITLTPLMPAVPLPALESPAEPTPTPEEAVVIDLDDATSDLDEAAAPESPEGKQTTSNAPSQAATRPEPESGAQMRVGQASATRLVSFELNRLFDPRASTHGLTLQEWDAFPQHPGANIQLVNIPVTVVPNQTMMGIPSSGLDAPGQPAPVFTPSSQDENLVTLTSVSTAIKTGGLTLSLGVIWWATRASSLLTSLIITTPAWRTMDPLPILFSGDQDDATSSDAATTAEVQAERMFGAEAPRADDVAVIG